MDGGRAPSGRDGGGGKKPSGGLWGVFRKILDNVSIDVNLGAGVPAPRAPTGNPADPAARINPIRQDRKETYDEMMYRTTDGEQGKAPMERIDRERRLVARSIESRGAAAATAPKIPEGGGEPLAKDVRAKMEPKLGASLADVRVHQSGESSAAAQSLDAKAFTVGRDVHFASGNYQPGTKEGDRLLAHELTHVVQGQRAGVQRKVDEGAPEAAPPAGAEVSHPDEPAEKEADAVADGVADSLHGDSGKHEAAAAPAEKPAAVSAKFNGAGRKIFRSAATVHTAAAPSAKPPTSGAPAKDVKAACVKKGGAAAEIVAQLEGEVQIDGDTKSQLFARANDIFKKGGDPLDAIQQALKSDPKKFLCRGHDITLEAVTKEGGINRVLDLPSVFTYYLKDDVKDAKFHSQKPQFLDGASKGQFDPNRDLNEEAELSGWAPLTWWSAGPPLPGGADMGKIMKSIHVDNANYAEGGVRLDVTPTDFAKGMNANGLQIFKPTAFDGAFQVSAGGDKALFNQDKDGSQTWGITHGGAKEAVMKPMKIKVFKRRTLLVPQRPAAGSAVASAGAAGKKGKK